jgi:Raf kinase inhibitor-like YbhB/YbcL family protein
MHGNNPSRRHAPRILGRLFGVSIVTLAALAFAGVADAKTGFKVSSTDVGLKKPTAGEFVFNGFGCTGGNQSPEVHWSGAPAGTQSFAVSVYDPDAPTGSGWWHWFVVNLPASTTTLARGAGKSDGSKLPEGAQQINTDFGAPGYGGPCPPAGDKPHRYIVTVYALKVPKLDLPPSATAALAGFMVNANALGKARLTFKYGR